MFNESEKVGVKEGVMSNRRNPVLDPISQVSASRLKTRANGIMSAFPDAAAVGAREVRTAFESASRRANLEQTALPVGPIGQSHLHARLADLIHANSSVCHDLRQYLTVLIANIEFLYEADSAHLDKQEIYRELKVASEQMTDLIDSLRALGSNGAAIKPVPGNLEEIAKRALDAVKSRHPLRHRPVELVTRGAMGGTFDARKLERVFFNLVLNAFEVTTNKGKITVEIVSDKEQFRIRVRDDGSGVPTEIRRNLFEPAVSTTKSNGRGFGLVVVKKIINDHAGSVEVESTSKLGTVMLVRLPRVQRTTLPASRNHPPMLDTGEVAPRSARCQRSA
jgi:signal transduction histidine kinase